MTADQAFDVLDDALAIWSTQALEDHPKSSEPFEIQALRNARNAVNVLRDLINQTRREAA